MKLSKKEEGCLSGNGFPVYTFVKASIEPGLMTNANSDSLLLCFICINERKGLLFYDRQTRLWKYIEESSKMDDLNVGTWSERTSLTDFQIIQVPWAGFVLRRCQSWLVCFRDFFQPQGTWPRCNWELIRIISVSGFWNHTTIRYFQLLNGTWGTWAPSEL